MRVIVEIAVAVAIAIAGVMEVTSCVGVFVPAYSIGIGTDGDRV